METQIMLMSVSGMVTHLKHMYLQSKRFFVFAFFILLGLGSPNYVELEHDCLEISVPKYSLAATWNAEDSMCNLNPWHIFLVFVSCQEPCSLVYHIQKVSTTTANFQLLCPKQAYNLFSVHNKCTTCLVRVLNSMCAGHTKISTSMKIIIFFVINYWNPCF